MSHSITKGVSWNDVQSVWHAHYESFHDDAKKAVQTFFEHQNFFAESASTFGIPLVLGISQSDARWEVFLEPHICEQLVEFTLESIPNYSPPELSKLALKSYEVIERFEPASASIFNRYKAKASKKNKAHVKLLSAKKQAELAKELVHGKTYIFVSVDIECYELDQSILLELGWSMYDAKTDRFLDQHYAIDSYKHLTNGKYVDDQRMRFAFGTTVWCSLKQALKEFRKDLDWAVERDGAFVLVGHGLDSDIKYLKQQKFHWPTRYGKETLEVEDSANVIILNTDVIYGASINNIHNPPSLGKTLDIFDLEHWNLHNAGNDAHYTLLLLMKLVDYHF